ncbi:nucleolar and spindle-associated protein 1-C-like [Lingula anatina]|uniref:Nucleolar and spindle-associated protein 1-C-like n=1 Tax=Lingula anatina TaxID=7574 RepID=A0A1S3I122_LINAN|nr:nucleolar and spindle-associated protein 1-C-like [Lingula anatina]|eukprot:XP_013391526.1 nucleolar and spindle-associated protein 1-C-like [Lingula anatina]
MYTLDELEGLKYAKLQELAKEAGIKANVKAEKLVRDLAKHYDNLAGKDGSSEESDAKSPKEKPARKIAKGKKGNKRKKQIKADESPTETDKQEKERIKTPAKSPKVMTPKPKRLSVIKAEETRSSPKASNGAPSMGSKSNLQDGEARKSKGTPSSAQGLKRKRQNEDSFQKTATPQEQQSESRVSTGRAKRVRTGTYDKEDSIIIASSQSSKNSSPALSGGKESASLTEKKEAANKTTEGTKPKTQTNIPRFAAFAAKKKAEKKPVTPGNKDWAKIHQKNFDKMDSIDVYLEKKRERTKSITASVKKARMLTEQAKASVQKLKNHRTPTNKGPKFAKPVKASLFKSPHSGVPFVPSVTSTSKMNLNFNGILKTPIAKTGPTPGDGIAKTKAVTVKSPAKAADKSGDNTKENKEKRKSMVKRKSVGDSRKSIGAGRKSIGDSRKSIEAGRKSIGDSRKSIGTTPFKFGNTTLGANTTLGNTALDTSQPATNKKPVFDLKASLAKPITWKPYTGKLKPINFKTEGHQQLANKGPKLQTREDRRAAASLHRANKKYDMQLKRRKIANA